MIRRNREAALTLFGAVAFFAVVAVVRDDAARLRPYLQVVATLVIATALADRAARFSRPMVWALTSVAVAHLVGGLAPPIGDAPTFYETWLIEGVLKFDQVAHAYGSGVLTLACAQLAVGLLGPVMQRGTGLAVVAALMALGLGAINELVEFVFGLGNPNLHAGGMENTGWDLAFNLAGTIVGAVLIVSTHDGRDDRVARRADAGLRRLRPTERRAGAVVPRRPG